MNFNQSLGEKINFNTPNRNDILKNGFNPNIKKSFIGSGSYGIVIKGFYKDNNVAVKIIEKTNEYRIQAVKNEHNVLGLKHKNITTTLKIESSQLHSIIIMETFPGHCLQYLIDNIEVSLYHRIQICIDVISGLNFCHSNGIVHLDVKPKNILISYLNLYNRNKYVCKLCDFGSSIKLNSHKEFPKSMGTVRYMAPEILKRDSLSTGSDIYSFGITMWQLKSRSYPYFQIDSNEIVTYRVVKDDLRPNLIKKLNKIKGEIKGLFIESKLDCFCDDFSSNCNSLNNINPISLNQVNFPELLLNPQVYNVRSREKRPIFKGLSNQFVSKKEETQGLNENKRLIYKQFFNQGPDLFNDYDKVTELEENYDRLFQCCWEKHPSVRPSGSFIQNKLVEFLISETSKTINF